MEVIFVMNLQVRECSMCHQTKAAVSFSRIDANVCTSCASKAIRQAKIDDESWLEQNKQAGIALWEHQPQEPADAFNAWVLYRDAYPKQLSTAVLAEAMDRSTVGINYWRKRWKWEVRWDGWAAEQDRVKIMAHAAELKDMNERQINVAKLLHDKAMNRVIDIDMEEMTPKEVIQWLEVAAKLERTAVVSNGEVLKTELSSRVTHKHEDEAKVKDGNVAEILAVLQSSGALDTGGLQITQTTTTVRSDRRTDATDDVSNENTNIVDIDFTPHYDEDGDE